MNPMEPRDPATFDPKPREPHASSPGSAFAPSQATEADLPRRFGRLMLLKHVARGGMGEVFLATAAGIEGAERPCVVKIIRREHASDRSFLARFLDEARIQSQLSHPGVAQIHEAATDPTGKPYVVLEYVEGRNLGEIRHRATQLGARIAWPDAVAIAVALTDALAHVHERTDPSGRPLDIVHRDLSPQNVMVGYGGEVKVIDFGTARAENRRCHTVAGVVFAKPGYVAPEVANNTPGGAPADLYAVGIMLWELLAGRRFLTGEATEHLAAVALGERRPTPLADGIDAPHELDAIVAKLTAHRVAARYACAREAMTDLVALLKRAPSATDGERSVRARVAHLVRRLYPAEPARTRAEFARLVSEARRLRGVGSAYAPELPLAAESGDSALLPGTRYRLVRTLGQGAMGTVYEAEQVDLGRRVAIKALTAPGVGAADHAERFRSEARAIAQLRHENLVAVFDYGVAADGRPFYVMEYLDGQPLDGRLAREGHLPWQEAAELGIQVCRALEVAHAAGLVHRDIKPGNLFVGHDGRLKLLDFGVAKRAASGQVAEGRGEAIEIFGTPEYMAPEQSLGTADARSDIYAVGVVLYELLAGALPHSADNLLGLMDGKRRSDPQPVSRRSPQRGIPRMLEQTIQTALARAPEQRFQSAGALREALEAALREPLVARARRRRVAGVAAALGVLAVAGVATFGVTQPAAAHAVAERVGPALHWFGHLVPGQATGAALAAGGGVPVEVAAPPVATAPPSAPRPGAAGVEPAAAHGLELAAADEEEGDGLDSALGSDEVGEIEPDGIAAGVEAAASEDDDAEGVEVSAADPSEVAATDPVLAAVEASTALVTEGRALKAYGDLRRLAKRHPSDTRVLAALVGAAAATRSWGEAYRAARRWVEVEPGAESRLELARMARAVGKRDEALAALKKVLAEQPDHAQARELLERVSPASALALK